MTTETRQSSTVTLDAQGRILIPAELRREKGWEPGQKLRALILDGHVVLMTPQEAGRLAQEIFMRDMPKDGRSLVDELIAERRAAAAQGD